MPGERGRQRSKASRWLVWLLALGLVVALVVVVGRPFDPSSGPGEIPYSRFTELVEQDRVVTASISTNEIEGLYTDAGERVGFLTLRPPGVDDSVLLAQLEAHDVEFSGEPPGTTGSSLLSIVGLVLPIVLFAGLWLFLSRRSGAGVGAMAYSRSQAKIVDRTDLHTTFADVAGVDEAVEELREVVDFLRSPQRYSRLGGRIPKGVLLVGPPGTGKTLLARAVAGEASVPFFYLSGSDFVELFVGVGAARVRDLFEQAKTKAPAIVFIDEIDTIGRSRAGAAGGPGAHEEREQTLAQLLAEMDGFDSSAGVIIMAATNRPEVLDTALLRPGRFDRQIVVDLPDRRGRAAILRVHTQRVKLAPDADLDVLAARTPGLAGAELANVVNEGALLAARRGRELVGMAELEEAIDRVSVGLERRSRVLREEERQRVAHHELGHALVALACPHADPVHRVSIVPRGIVALGITQQLPAEDRYLITQPELEDRLTVMLGGRAAELLVYGELSTGAQNDLQQANALARRMVEEFGMSERLGPVTLARSGLFLPLDGRRADAASQQLANLADAEVERLLNEAEERAAAILAPRREGLERLARLLLERETLEGDELEAALRDPVRGAVALES